MPVSRLLLASRGLGMMGVLSRPNTFQSQPRWDLLHSPPVPGSGESKRAREGMWVGLADPGLAVSLLSTPTAVTVLGNRIQKREFQARLCHAFAVGPGVWL